MDNLLVSEHYYTNQYRAFGWRRERKPASVLATKWSLEGALEKASSFFSRTNEDENIALGSARYKIRVAYTFFGIRGDFETFWKDADFATAKKVLQKAIQLAR